MIRNEKEYQEALRRFEDEEQRLAEHEERLRESDLEEDALQRALDPLRSFHDQLAEEISAYEKLKRGDLGEITNLHGLGHTLVALRISLGLTQREVAERLGVHESQVSRDERNEYHGITVERAARVLDAFNVRLTSGFERPLVSGRSRASEAS